MGSGSGARPVRRPVAAVAVFGVLATIVLAWSAWVAYDRNEERLLVQRTREASAVLALALPAVQTPLTSSAELAEASDGDVALFRRFARTLVGPGGPFTSVSLWVVDAPGDGPSAVVGAPPVLLGAGPERIRAELERAVATPLLTVVNLLGAPDPRLGYAATGQQERRFVVYGESPRPAEQTTGPAEGQAFAGLDFAVYVGDDEDPAALMLASVVDLPLEGRRARELVPFGADHLLLVMTPSESLSGRLLWTLPWLIGAVGLLFTAGAAALTRRLLLRGRQAEALSAENHELYARQRTIAQTLQRSLLADRLPEVAPLDIAARYEPGVQGLEIGGDWYDALLLDDTRLLFVVGDVSGRGLGAAAAMASLRFSTRAYAREGHGPAGILTRLGPLLDVARDGHFATVLCAHIDIARRELTVANAGHPSPLLVDGGDVRLLATHVGVPIGMGLPPGSRGVAPYSPVTVTVGPGATLIGFTDGLFERRGESWDEGLERLRRLVQEEGDVPLERLLTRLAETLAGSSDDDSAMLAVRWRD